jgi:Ca2+-binding EF-hand superfamily protein
MQFLRHNSEPARFGRTLLLTIAVVVGFLSSLQGEAFASSSENKVDFSTIPAKDLDRNSRKNFHRLDVDNDGYISANEAPSTDYYESLSAVAVKKDGAWWIRHRDENRDGKVDIKEFSDALRRMKSKN